MTTTSTSIQTSKLATATGPAPRGRRLRIVAAVATLGFGLLVGCGEAVDGTGPETGAVTPGRSPVSADAAERRSAAVTRSPVSADAAERRAAGERTGTAPVSADAAERRAAELQAQLREEKDPNASR